jgi:hypothetical protein
LGVNNINYLTECTKVLPPAVTSFQSPDQKYLDQWLDGAGSQATGQKIADGNTIV